MVFALLSCTSGGGQDSSTDLVCYQDSDACTFHVCASYCLPVDEALECCQTAFDSFHVTTAEHALCAAQVQGMEPGIEDCFVAEQFLPSWRVRNVLNRECGATGHIDGRTYVIDEWRGFLVAQSTWTATTFGDECDE